MFIKINSFIEIIDKITDNTLIVLDIDDTILRYTNMDQNWWKQTTQTYFDLHSDVKIATKKTMNVWQTLLHETTPEHTDEPGIRNLYKKIKEYNNCHLIYLTARDLSVKEITEKHFMYLKLEYLEKVIYTAGGNKGDFLKNIIKETYSDKIKYIFVDDFGHNLEQVKNKCDFVECYKFEYSVNNEKNI